MAAKNQKSSTERCGAFKRCFPNCGRWSWHGPQPLLFYVGPCFSINKELRNSMFWKLTLGNRVIVNCDRARLRHLLDMTSRVGLIKNGAGVFLGGYSCKYLGHISVLDVEL